MQSVNGAQFLNITLLSCLSATATLTSVMVPLTNQFITQKSFPGSILFYLGNSPPNTKPIDCSREPLVPCDGLGKMCHYFLLIVTLSTNEITF